MGLCLCTRTKRCDSEEDEKRFWVINVNDSGKKRCPGIMELTETCIVLHLERGGFIKWPYISLIKYGYNSNLFSFISGRRCQTGEGIFGFRCSRAEELFNKLQSSMMNNRISIMSDADSDITTCTIQTLPYRYEPYPSITIFPSFAALSPWQRIETCEGEMIPDVTSPQKAEQPCTCKASQEDRVRKRSYTVERDILDGISQTSPSLSCLAVSWEHEEKIAYQHPVFIFQNQMENEELNYTNWDTGYDIDERREASCIRLGYENIDAFPSEFCRSRSMLVSVSSNSESQNNIHNDSSFSAVDFECQPSSPSIFEEKCNLEQRFPVTEEKHSLHNLPVGQNLQNNLDPVGTYFNFDMRWQAQECNTLNYIQVEMETSTENPQTPRSTDTSMSWAIEPQCELYAQLDLEKTAALSLMQKQKPNDDGTRRTRHNGKQFPI
ncbi:fibroblast growth factor receptor substrate 2-like [Pelodytes ibericus]